MQFNFFRNILVGFVALVVVQVIVLFVAVAMLGDVADRLQTESSTVAAEATDANVTSVAFELKTLAESVRSGQVAVLGIGLIGLLVGLVAMVFAANYATRLLGRLKDSTQQLADVVLEDELAVTASDSVDDLELEIRKMMRKIQDSQLLCLDASPLTRLPGNRAIEQVIKEKMARDERFALCYVDLDDFKAYNDTYGYARGSELIKLTGEIVHNAKAQYAATDDFVGHIGGDDFVLIVASERAQPVCESIIAAFDRAVPDFYDESDRERGYIECSDRYGVVRQFPLMTISIAVVSDSRRDFSSPIEIAQVATEIKDYVKTLPGSNYLLDRRTSMRAEP
mgnify:CR=1 FL=1